MSKNLEFKIMHLLTYKDKITVYDLIRDAESYYDLYDTLVEMSKNKQISIYDDENGYVQPHNIDKIITFTCNVKYYHENI